MSITSGTSFWTTAVLLSIASVNGQNLLRNGSFDAGLANWISTPTRAAWTNDDGRSAPGQLVHWSASSFSVTSMQNISDLVPGVYTLSGWLRTTLHTTTVMFGARGCRSGSITDIQEVAIPRNTTTWTQFFVPVVVQQRQCRIYLRSSCWPTSVQAVEVRSVHHRWSTLRLLAC